MDSKNSIQNNYLPAENIAVQPKFNFRSPMLWIQTVILLIGSGILFYVVYRIGLQTITDAFSRIGWGFLLIVLLNGARHFLRAWCIYLVIPSEHRAFKYRHALAARLGGEAVSVVTFTGPFLGDFTKAMLLKTKTAFTNSAAAIIVDNILYYISVILMILGGVGILLYNFGGVDKILQYALFAVSAFAFLIITGLILVVKFHFKPTTWLLKKVYEFNLLPEFINKKRDYVRQIEDNVFEFYLNHKSVFYIISGLIIISHILSVAEVYLVLYLLKYTVFPSTAYIIESLTKVINLAFSFVPGAIGVYEGGNGLILHFLGYTTAIGVIVALIRRGAILFWTFIGLAILLWRTVNSSTQQLSRRIK